MVWRRARSVRASLGSIIVLLRRQLVQVVVETRETRVPESAIVIRPFGHLLDRRGLEVTGSPLRVAPARDEARTLEHLEMLRDGRPAHRERFGELADGAIPARETREDGAPSRIGESSERERELIG